jgi:hypothetical protein
VDPELAQPEAVKFCIVQLMHVCSNGITTSSLELSNRRASSWRLLRVQVHFVWEENVSTATSVLVDFCELFMADDQHHGQFTLYCQV